MCAQCRRQRDVDSWVRGASSNLKFHGDFFIGGDMEGVYFGAVDSTCFLYIAVRLSGLTWTWDFASNAAG